jgi:hypothetical protein
VLQRDAEGLRRARDLRPEQVVGPRHVAGAMGRALALDLGQADLEVLRVGALLGLRLMLGFHFMLHSCS